MTSGTPVKLKFPSLDAAPYVKVDICKASRVGDSFSVSCFQFDYQAAAEVLEKAGETPKPVESPDEIPMISVCRMVLDEAGFERLRNEINLLHRKFTERKELEKGNDKTAVN